jgi:site-specific recombinase XerD
MAMDSNGKNEQNYDSKINKILPTPDTLKAKAMVAFFKSSACRIEELCKLKVKDINFEESKAILPESGENNREVHFTQNTSKLLQEYIKSFSTNEDFLFQ